MLFSKTNKGLAGIVSVIGLLAFSSCTDGGQPEPTPSVKQEPRVMTPVDMVELNRLSNPTQSPDGRYVLYLRRHVDWDENVGVNRYQLHDLTTGELAPVFEAEKSKESFSRGVWSPDSHGFLTLLKRKPKKKDDEFEDRVKDSKQVHFYNVETQSLRQLTFHASDVSDLQWAPDGKGFYFRAPVAKPQSVLDQLDDDIILKEYETRQRFEVWYFDLETEQEKKVIGGDYFVRAYDLSRDGGHILHMRADGGLSDDRQEGELWTLDLITETATQLTENTYAESGAELSPSNDKFAFIATVNAQGETYYEGNLFVQTIGSDQPELILPDMAMEMRSFAWDQSGEGLFILGNTGLETEIYHYDLKTGALVALTQGEHAVNGWSYNEVADQHIYLNTSAENPGEVTLLKTGDDQPEQVSHNFDGWADRFLLPRQEAFAWTANDDVNVEGLLVYPVRYEEGDQFPLVTITHGGPRSASQFGAWNTSRAVPVLTGHGYGVFLPNYRGGTGYGDAFLRDMVGGYFNHAHTDVMEGIDALIDASLADPDQLVKQGWSAGGHLTNYLVTYTDRFKVASSGAGVGDWISMYGESDVRYNRTPWFGAAPWDENAPLDVYIEHSPLRNTWKVTTPTMFWNGAKDVRVPPTQSIMMYRGVKAAGTETELYLAPNQPHGFRIPTYQLFKMNTELAWYAKHLDREIPGPVLPQGLVDAEK